jgi:predicted dehydrogenase
VAAGRVRIAVAGAGAFGREHLQRLAAMTDVEIAGLADISRGSAAAAAAQFDIARIETDARALIAGAKPDGLIIATPGPTHVPLAREALNRGIPVLVEKPVGMSTVEVEALAKAEQQSQGFVLPGHVLRFSRHHRMLEEIARSAEIGRMLSFTSRRHRDDSHAARYADVDPVLMTMIHDIDLGLWMTGAGIVAAHAVRQPPGMARSDTMMTGRGANGVSWHLHASWTFAGMETPPDRVEIVGENGSVELEAGATIRQFGARARVIDLTAVPEDPLADELAYFVHCIRSGERPTVVTMVDAVAAIGIADAAIAAARINAAP